MNKKFQSRRSIRGIVFGALLAATAFNPVATKAQESVDTNPNQTVTEIIPASGQNLKAWVWANNPTASNYTPSASYQYNSKGATNTVSRLGVGRYRVSLPNFATASGTVHVTAYNGNHHCKVVNWSQKGTTQQVNVSCWSANGSRVDDKFSMLFYKRSARTSGTDAYLWYNGSSTPNAYQWNSKGLNNTVTKLGTGRYQANLPGMNKLGGTVLVTAYGSDSAKCKVVNWGRSASNTRVKVNCFRGNQPVNTKFTLSYINGTNGVGLGIRHKGGYVWANKPNVSGTYTPSTTYQWNSATLSNSSNRVTNLSTGSYRVRLPRLAPANKTTTQVTAYGSNSDYCNVRSWVSDGSGGTNANVRCFNSAGQPVNTRFTLTYLTDDNI
ncbi:MAG: hypothetical protein AAF757_05935 [Cyanobacteria bacterium P01_D01_bin.116]